MAFMMYMERGAIGAAAPTIMKEFHISKITMGWVVSAFNWSYTAFQIPGGWLADRYGPRIVLAGAMAWWSIFTAGTGLTFNALSLAATRMLFGAGEAAAFPSGSRAMVRWLPVRRRAFGQGFQHAGSRLGAALAPLVMISLIAPVGWRVVFLLFGVIGILWSICWYWYYRNLPTEHAGVNQAELEILADAAPKAKIRGRVPWARIFRCRDLWRLSFAYFCYGWVLWLFLAWLPTYLREARHFTVLKSGLASLPLFAATLTNVVGGLASDKLAHRWRNLRSGRIAISIIGYTVAGIGLVAGALAPNAALALACLTVALGGLELTVAVSWAVCIDLGGEYSGSVSSVMNTLGNLGGAVSAVMVGYFATLFGWTSPFLLGATLCLLSVILMRGVDPRRAIAN